MSELAELISDQVMSAARALFQHEESFLRGVLRHCSLCGRPAPWNPPDGCCYPGDGALAEWSLVRSDAPSIIASSNGFVAIGSTIKALWCPDCASGKPKVNPWWMRI